MSEVRS